MQLGALELALVCPPVSLGLEYMPFIVGLKDQRDGWPSAGKGDPPLTSRAPTDRPRPRSRRQQADRRASPRPPTSTAASRSRPSYIGLSHCSVLYSTCLDAQLSSSSSIRMAAADQDELEQVGRLLQATDEVRPGRCSPPSLSNQRQAGLLNNHRP
jgi:hypothetical protein